MLLNKNTIIYGDKVILIPYKVQHVLKYHGWMQSEELQQLTASEPLSLNEEYEMQKSWMVDENKCTFIILDRSRYETTKDEIESMIGDTNLFISSLDCAEAEAEIMIAEEWARGKKCGTNAMILMLLYGIENLGLKQYLVKISDNNSTSFNLFSKLGFDEKSYCKYFKETTYIKIVDDSWVASLKNQVGLYDIRESEVEMHCN